MSNADVESRAIELVVAYEMKRRNITTSESVVRMPRGQGYDLQSGDRNIEVKGSEGNTVNTGFRLNSSQEIAFVEGGGYVYRVLDVFGSPRLYILEGAKLTFYKGEWASVSAPKELLDNPIEL